MLDLEAVRVLFVFDAIALFVSKIRSLQQLRDAGIDKCLVQIDVPVFKDRLDCPFGAIICELFADFDGQAGSSVDPMLLAMDARRGLGLRKLVLYWHTVRDGHFRAAISL